MAIDINFYSEIETNILNQQLDEIRKKYGEYFDYRYILYTANKVLAYAELSLLKDSVERYSMESNLLISQEFGLAAPKSSFMMSLNDKSYTGIFPEALARLVKKELHQKHPEKSTIALFNFDSLIV